MANNNTQVKRSSAANIDRLMGMLRSGNISDSQVAYVLNALQNSGGIDSFYQELAANPAMQKRIQMFNTSPEAQYYTGRIKDWGNIAKNLAGLGLGIAQTTIANKDLENIHKPSPTPPFQEIPQLATALDAARTAYESPETAGLLSPAKQAIADAYSAQVENIKNMSGGQSGAIGAGTQAAYTARLKQAQQLPMLAANLQAKNAAMYGNLLGTAARNKYSESIYNLGKSRQDWNRYLTESQIAGQLGQTGLKNIFNSSYGVVNQLAPSLGRLFAGNKSYTGLGGNVDNYNSYIDNEFRRREGITPAPDFNDVNIGIPDYYRDNELNFG